MVNIITIKKSLHKNKSEKIKVHKNNFLEIFWYAITNRLNCQREDGLDVYSLDHSSHLVGMRQLNLVWVSEANKQVIESIVTKKLKNNQIW